MTEIDNIDFSTTCHVFTNTSYISFNYYLLIYNQCEVYLHESVLQFKLRHYLNG